MHVAYVVFELWTYCYDTYFICVLCCNLYYIQHVAAELLVPENF